MFRGRINRTTYILASLILLGIAIVIEYSGVVNWETDTFTLTEWILLPLMLCVAAWGFGISIRRLHDLGMPGIVVLLVVLPGVAFVLALLPGQKRANKYGQPHRKHFDFSSLLMSQSL